MNYFIFNGFSSLDFDVHISGAGTYTSPEKDVEYIEVAGKNGDLIIDNGRWKNGSMAYDCFIVKDFKRNIRAFKNFMNTTSNYCRLEDTYHDEYFMLASFSSSIDPSTIQNVAGSFTITFSCKPQRFLKEGEKAYTLASGTTYLYNNYIQTAKPLVTLYGTGTATVNGVQIDITTNTNGIVLDCEVQEAYDAVSKTTMNASLVLSNREFFTLPSGKNEIILADGMTGTIVPRWFII